VVVENAVVMVVVFAVSQTCSDTSYKLSPKASYLWYLDILFEFEFSNSGSNSKKPSDEENPRIRVSLGKFLLEYNQYYS
jgi:hypothetical protein